MFQKFSSTHVYIHKNKKMLYIYTDISACVCIYVYVSLSMLMFHSLSGEDLKGGIPTQSELALNPGQHFSIHQLKPIIRRGNYGGDSPSHVIFCV